MFKTTPKQITGNVDTRDQEIEELRAEVETLRAVMSDSIAAADHLRTVLTPLYEALKMVFGDLDALPQHAGSNGSSAGATSDLPAAWKSWQEKLPGRNARAIEVLWHHGELNAQQLRVHLQCHINRVYETTAKLTKLGLIVQPVKGRYSLKKI